MTFKGVLCILVSVPLIAGIDFRGASLYSSAMQVTSHQEYIEEWTDPPEEYVETALGKYKITAYCSCEICCGEWSKYNKTRIGTTPTANHTIAVDPNKIPLGSIVRIGDREYVAEDTGSAVKGNVIDIYFSSHQDALNFGRQYKNVYLVDYTLNDRR